MKDNFYYNKKNNYYDKMELDEKRYPVWKESKIHVHITQAEKKIGRKLEPSEVVHHIDGDKLNYDMDNLVVLSREDHNNIERDLWKYNNVLTLNFFVIGLSFFFLVYYLSSKNVYFIYITLILLVFAMFIPFFPNTLRKILFKLGILRKNKQNRFPFQTK